MELADCPGDLGKPGFQINRRAIVEIMATVGNITAVAHGAVHIAGAQERAK